MSHHIDVCAHGKVQSQCRCPAKDKPRILVPCVKYDHSNLPVVYFGIMGRTAIPIVETSRIDETAPIPYTGAGNQFQINTDPVGSDDHDALVALIRHISPIKHEPLATAVAEEWAAEFEKEGWHR